MESPNEYCEYVFTVEGKNGLHARPAMMLMEACQGYRGRVEVSKDLKLFDLMLVTDLNVF